MFSVKAFELYQILDSVLFKMYLISTHEDNFDAKLVQLLDIDKKLLEWKRSLPSHLQIQATSTTNPDPILDRQATILKIRYVIRAECRVNGRVLSHFTSSANAHIDFYMFAYYFFVQPSSCTPKLALEHTPGSRIPLMIRVSVALWFYNALGFASNLLGR